jgi:hypothetical protein
VNPKRQPRTSSPKQQSADWIKDDIPTKKCTTLRCFTVRSLHQESKEGGSSEENTEASTRSTSATAALGAYDAHRRAGRAANWCTEGPSHAGRGWVRRARASACGRAVPGARPGRTCRRRVLAGSGACRSYRCTVRSTIDGRSMGKKGEWSL